MRETSRLASSESESESLTISILALTADITNWVARWQSTLSTMHYVLASICGPSESGIHSIIMDYDEINLYARLRTNCSDLIQFK